MATQAVVPVSLLLGVGDVDPVADGLDAEGGHARRDLAVQERAWISDGRELAVEGVHGAGPEVAGVKPLPRAGRSDGEALVDGAVQGVGHRRVVNGDERLRPFDRGAPTGDGAVFGG